MTEQINPTKSKISLLLLMLVFVAPLLIAWWFFSFSHYVVEGPKSNKGELIQPIIQLPDLTLTHVTDSTQTRSTTGRWGLFHIVADECAGACEKILYTLHQIEQLTGKDSLRIQRIILLLKPEQAMEKISLHPGQWLVTPEQQELGGLLDQLRRSLGPLTSGDVYIIDPLGNLIMRYPPDFDPNHILEDLKFLLKASKIG